MLVRTVEPTWEPLTLGEAKAHLRVEHPVDDTLIEALIVAARDYAEVYTRRAIPSCTYRLYLDAFPCLIELAMPPVRSVSSIVYVDDDGDETTLATDQYTVDTKTEPARITPAYGLSWPTARCQLNAVYVEFAAGWASAADVPRGIKQAMLLMIGRWYATREADNAVPTAADALLNMHRWGSYA